MWDLYYNRRNMDTTFETVALIHVRFSKILLVSSRGRKAFYLPGGKINEGEEYIDALIREVKEEISVDLIPESIKAFGVFEALAHDKPIGMRVRTHCYAAESHGDIKKNNEIENMQFFSHDQFFEMSETAPVVRLVVKDLKEKGIII